MKTFECMRIDRVPHTRVVSKVNAAGMNRWELVSVIEGDPSIDEGRMYDLYFRRAVASQELGGFGTVLSQSSVSAPNSVCLNH